jgi:glyoxylase-like metal-dependent hydrolase (beta-lactamase superfamily II)
MLPYGKSLSMSSYFVLLNYNKKMLVNTGVIESQGDLEALLNTAGLDYSDLDYIVNMSSRPEHIGLNSLIQYSNKKALFLAPPGDIAYIEDTVRAHEERYVPGFYRMVSGNTEGVEALCRGRVFDLGGEKVSVSIDGDERTGKYFLDLQDSCIKLYPDGVCLKRQEKHQVLLTKEAVNDC